MSLAQGVLKSMTGEKYVTSLVQAEGDWYTADLVDGRIFDIRTP